MENNYTEIINDFFKVSDFVLIEKTKKEAIKVFEEIDKYPELLEKTKQINLDHVSPD